MDEYFCPNCGATLNDQPGFDPDGGTWTCTSCGKLLMDDDVYDGDTFEGVAWYCDDCGELLNRQSGFSDSYGSWRCTNCGHVNGTTEDDIVNDGPKCPNCGALLKDQYSFSDWSNDHTCSDCGAKLHRDYSFDDYEEVDVAEEDDEAESPRYYQSKEQKVDTQYSAPREKSHATYSSSTTKAEEKLPDSELRKKRLKAFFFKRKKIVIGYAYTELLRKNYEIVVTALHNKGFNSIKAIPVKDIYKSSPYCVGEVEQVVINGSSYFNKQDQIPYDAEIIITYHEKREITIPFSERSLRKENYVLAGDKLQQLGFTEIYEKPIRDLVTGWIKRDGTIEKITIGGVYPFKKNSVFPYDVEIVIEYHTFKEK